MKCVYEKKKERKGMIRLEVLFKKLREQRCLYEVFDDDRSTNTRIRLRRCYLLVIMMISEKINDVLIVD